MSLGIKVSPRNSIYKTRNAILRIKNCSPELKSILRQRCQERIQNERLKVLNSHRKIPIKESFKAAFNSIVCDKRENIQGNESYKTSPDDSILKISTGDFNVDEELLLEELLKKELLNEHDEWLIQQYEYLLNEVYEEIDNSNNVVCPLCCSGFLEAKNFTYSNRIECSKCLEKFSIEKSLLDLQSAIYECLSWHERWCTSSPGFVNIFKNEEENNLCIVCDECSFINVLA